MSFSSFWYLFKEGFKNVYVNRLMSFASIGTLMACMLLIGSSLLFSMNVNSVVGYMERQPDMTVILESDIDDDQLKELDTRISMIDNVYDMLYIDKDQLLEETIAQTSEMGEYLEDLRGEENPLYGSFRLKLKDQSRMLETKRDIEAMDGIEQVHASSDVSEIITSIKSAVSVGGFSIVAILIVVSLVIIANTIKVTVFNRRKEISIMKCVGATDYFIRMPFCIEGFLIGIISAALAFGLLWVGYDYVMGMVALNESSWVKNIYENMLAFPDVAWLLAAYFAGGGVFIGVVGSMFFVGKYLKV